MRRLSTGSPRARAPLVLAALAVAALALPRPARAGPLSPPHPEGVAHGFLALRALDGEPLAEGDLVQTAAPGPGGTRLSTRLTLRFADGSLHEERTVWIQGKTSRLVRNEVVQRGPAFPRTLTSTVEEGGRVTVRWSEDGKERTAEERLELPPDVANGLLLPVVKGLSPGGPGITVSFVAFTPRPQLVKLEIAPDGDDPFSTGGGPRQAHRFRVKVRVPGVKGALASVLGKVPEDSFIWIVGGEAPTFVMAEQALFTGGPAWRLEMVAPRWPTPPAPPAR